MYAKQKTFLKQAGFINPEYLKHDPKAIYFEVNNEYNQKAIVALKETSVDYDIEVLGEREGRSLKRNVHINVFLKLGMFAVAIIGYVVYIM